MKIKILAVLVILASLLVPFINAAPVSAAVSVSPLNGTVGSIAYVNGLTENTTYSIKWNGFILKSGTVSPSSSVFFHVPVVPRGPHYLVVENPINTIVLSTTFYVNPSIEMSPVSGIKDTVITVTGRGFASNEPNIRITYDSNIITRNINADFTGSFVFQFVVPDSTRGIHLVDALGTVTSPGEVLDLSFVMYPSIKVNPLQGCVGTMVEVTGSGFGASESDIRVAFDGQVMKSGIVSGFQGDWKTSFIIPEASKGTHKINVLGSSALYFTVQPVQFTVTASAFISPVSGNVGDIITVSGRGFDSRESGITITYDDVILKREITADAEGYWETEVTIPASTAGLHNIGAYGNSTTSLNCSFTTLTVQSKIVLSPAGGNVGDTISISGTGFSRNQPLAMTYGGNSINITGTTDSTGNLFTSFQAPGGRHGDIEVSVSDSGGARATAIFSMETNPPPAPVLLSPANNARVGVIGSSIVTFQWSAVTDPSGVGYTIEAALDPGFNNISFIKDKIATNSYTLEEIEALPHGEYYWRVRAVDGAANEGDWSSSAVLKISYLSMESFIIIVTVLAVLIIIAIVLSLTLKPGRKK